MVTNDPTQNPLLLQIEGNVERFVDISPARLRMTGQAGDEVSGTVTIVPTEKYPFRILEAKPQKDGNIRVEVSEEKDKKGYMLTVFNLKQEQARYYDTIIVKTDSKIRPELTISVYCNLAAKPQAKSDGQG